MSGKENVYRKENLAKRRKKNRENKTENGEKRTGFSNILYRF